MALTAAQTKRIEDALCAGAVQGFHAQQLSAMREALVKEFEELKTAALKTAASTR